MSSLIPFSFNSREIRITDQDGTTWFILRDLLEAMESKTTTTAAVESINQGLGDGFVNDIPIVDSLGREQQAIIVAESSATYLLSRSNTEKGRELNRFIHVEVIPSIRKTGSYSVPNTPAAPSIRAERELQALARETMRTLKAFGIVGNAAVISTDNYCRAIAGRSLLAALDATHLLADPRGRTYTPTELGKMCVPQLSAIKLNLELEAAGLQKRDMGEWMPTDKAAHLCEWLDTGKRHGSGAPVKQLRWFRAVLERLPGAQRAAA